MATFMQGLTGVVIGILFVVTPCFAQNDEIVGSVSQLRGDVQVIRSSEGRGIAVGDAVFRGDELVTLEDSLVQVMFSDGSSFVLDENAQVAIAEYAPGTTPRSLLQLTRGRLRSQVSSAFSGRKDSYQVATQEGVMGVQGTEFEVVAHGSETSVYVYSGVVSVTSQDVNYPGTNLLRAGDFVSIRLGEPIQPPSRFFGVIDESTTASTADIGIGSGGEQNIISGGNQSVDPTAPAPTTSDQPSSVSGTPSPPRPPSKKN